ncbi:hypothetical protein FEDK69T_02500 [Flavobacterium enshiense DK69]|uniref:Uncharacterized protein n=1 Tax=Flavobacterium enshiense DK69 TaxID=1107311 RepID=V6SKY1_9FLAO|nr:hypothetical protein [Flavobacterium enshiense]ESU25060.1 hypothetical protein FEDK69T_02500 [Flavobacterium enshiense DK69]KGO96841.1 hypothetical protein Q767_03835 [Flavobacterium enshiense DK69]
MKKIIYSTILILFIANCYSQTYRSCVHVKCEYSVLDNDGNYRKEAYAVTDNNGKDVKEKEEKWLLKTVKKLVSNYNYGTHDIVSPNSGSEYRFEVVCKEWVERSQNNYQNDNSNSYYNQNYNNSYQGGGYIAPHNTSAPGIR